MYMIILEYLDPAVPTKAADMLSPICSGGLLLSSLYSIRCMSFVSKMEKERSYLQSMRSALKCATGGYSYVY